MDATPIWYPQEHLEEDIDERWWSEELGDVEVMEDIEEDYPRW